MHPRSSKMAKKKPKEVKPQVSAEVIVDYSDQASENMWDLLQSSLLQRNWVVLDLAKLTSVNNDYWMFVLL